MAHEDLKLPSAKVFTVATAPVLLLGAFGRLSGAFAAVVLSFVALGCGSPAPTVVAVPPADEPHANGVAGYPSDAGWDDVDVRAAHLHFRLPGGAPWKLVEQQGEATLTQAATRTTVRGRLVADADRMTRESCVVRAEMEGYSAVGELVEQTTDLVAGSFDTSIRIVAAEGTAGELVGIVLIVGANGRRCLFTRFETRVPGTADVALSDRLAAVRARFVPSLAVLPADSAPAREPPKPRRH